MLDRTERIMKRTNLILLALNLFYLVLPVKANPLIVAQSKCQLNPDLQSKYSLLNNFNCIYFHYDSPENAIASNLLLELFNEECTNEISKNQPTIKINNTELKLAKEEDGELSLHWSNAEGLFFESDKLELDVASKIGRACSEISMVGYHGGIGGASRWYIRSTNFSQRHYRDSGLPGDYDKYWNWFEIPTNYNPSYDYVN